MDTPILKIRGSWLIINGRRVWIREPDDMPEEDQ